MEATISLGAFAKKDAVFQGNQVSASTCGPLRRDSLNYEVRKRLDLL